MPVALACRADLTVEDLHDLLGDRFETEYAVYRPRLKDRVVVRGLVSGVFVAVKDREGSRWLIVGRTVPSGVARFFCLAIPIFILLVVLFAGWGVLREVRAFLDGSPEIRG